MSIVTGVSQSVQELDGFASKPRKWLICKLTIRNGIADLRAQSADNRRGLRFRRFDRLAVYSGCPCCAPRSSSTTTRPDRRSREGRTDNPTDTPDANSASGDAKRH
jgi:hypothetical protein